MAGYAVALNLPWFKWWFKVLGWIKYLKIRANKIVMPPFVRAQGLPKSFHSVYRLSFRAWK